MARPDLSRSQVKKSRLSGEDRKEISGAHWERALSQPPLLPGQTVLDLGRGVGDVSGPVRPRSLVAIQSSRVVDAVTC